MIGLVVLVALAVGVFLAALANFFANTNVSGPGWSLRGNGALFVPFGLGPAFLAMGWSGLILHARRAYGWERNAAIALAVGVVIALLGLFSLMFSNLSFGPVLYMVFIFLPWVWAVLAPAMWAFLPVQKKDEIRLSRFWYLAVGLLYMVLLVGGFFVAGRILA